MRGPVYTGAWFWNPQAGGSGCLGDHPLWVSGYTDSPPMPAGWGGWTYWQYTDAESIPGIGGGVDCSVAAGTKEDLFRLAGLLPKTA